MTNHKISVVVPAISGVGSLRGLYADMAKYGCVFEPDPAPGITGDQLKELLVKKPVEPPTPPTPPAPAPAPVVPPAPVELQVSDAEKALRAELDLMRTRMAAFGDVTPDQVKELTAIKAAAERAKVEADAAAKKTEEDVLRKAGDFEALRARMATEHTAELEASTSKISALDLQLAELAKTLSDLNISREFSDSAYLAETILTPAKARKIYGDHFELVDGKLVGYDAPKGTAKRVAYVDARGEPLPFDGAIKRIVEADPDRDTLLRAKIKSGAGISPTGQRPDLKREAAEPTGAGRIKLGLSRLRTGA